jgi:hypothetical protein
MDKRLFTLLINSLKRQNDVDKELARKLTDAYDVDIFPPDNRILIDAITEVLRVSFPENIDTITFYCWEEDFGKVSGYSVEDLWNVLNGKVTQTPVPKFRDNWDDAENDAKYSKADPKYSEIPDLKKAINYAYDNPKFNTIKKTESGITFHIQQSDDNRIFETLFGGKISNKVDEAIKNIQVQEFTVISPIRKFRDNK